MSVHFQAMRLLRRNLPALALIVSLLFPFVVAETVRAASANDPNSNKELMHNFRRGRRGAKYEYNKRALERRKLRDINRLIDEAVKDTGSGATATGETVNTFRLRSRLKRQFQQERIERDIERRKFTGQRRGGRFFWDREDRTEGVQQRRIKRAIEKQSFLPVRRTDPRIRIPETTSERNDNKKQQIYDYREFIRNQERLRYQPQETSDCSGVRGKRLADCLYRLRTR